MHLHTLFKYKSTLLFLNIVILNITCYDCELFYFLNNTIIIAIEKCNKIIIKKQTSNDHVTVVLQVL